MALVDIIKSWFGKNDKKAPNPTPTPVVSAPKAKTTATAPTKTKQAVSTTTNTEPEAGGNNQLSLINNPQTAFSVKQITLKKIDDPKLLAEIALTHKIAKIRQQAAEQLNDATLIHDVAHKAKHKDKGVYRILRQKIDQESSQQQQSQAQQDKLSQLCQDLEHHLQAAHTPLFAAKVQSLQQQWQQLATNSNDSILQQRFDKALQQAQQTIQEENTQKTLLEQQQQVANSFAQLEKDVLLIESVEQISEFSSKLNALAFDWQYCTQHTQIENTLAQKVQKQQQKLQQYSDLLQKSLTSLEKMQHCQQQLTDSPLNQPAYDELNALLQENNLLHSPLNLPVLLKGVVESFNTSQQAITAYQHALNKQQNTPETTTPKKQKHPELDKLFAQINEEFTQGRSKEADKLLRKAQKYAKTHHVHDHRLGESLDKLQQMKEWAGFAILPKKQDLVAQMKQLCAQANDTEPLTQFDKIKALQAEWQSLGTVYNDAEKALWEEFKQLGQEAYAPCQVYFDAQNAIQEQNAAARQQLCDELQHYLDNLPEMVNWQGHVAILKQAREDWQKHHPVEAKKHKQLQSRFNNIIKALENKLHAEYDLQESHKKALIAEVTQLLEHENVFDACQKAKELQNTWKTLGFCGHQKEHALWQQFKEQCDALFAKREAHKEAQKAQEQMNIQLAEHILDELDKQLNSPQATPNAHKIQPLITDFSKLFLPKEVNQALRKRFNVLVQQWQTYSDSQIIRQKQAQLKQIETAWDLCVAAEKSKLSGQAVSLSLALTWQGLVIPQPFKNVLQKRWQSISSLKKITAEEQQTRQQNALDMCLLLELLLDIDSPSEVKTARTAKKMALFEQQAYPKTEADTLSLISQQLQALLLTWGLNEEFSQQIKQRLHAILQSPTLTKLV
ncbi:MAG: DUF349 domain-containing protein [Moraxellaceae bacterium]|nr:DUF349 domain-containing protein [Moraxellaceae bacterium]